MADVAYFHTKPPSAFKAQRGISTYKKGGFRIDHETNRTSDKAFLHRGCLSSAEIGVGWLKCPAERDTISARLAAEGNRTCSGWSVQR